ncbi:MAG TPA: hypothetical protein VGR07_21775 [Thermoanaerobaculia bacterium]|nr:hypothetical protein [Thermoanaerobaculia bacterium]
MSPAASSRSSWDTSTPTSPAKPVGWSRWREKFWGRRYQAIPISEAEAAEVERLRYVLAHGCKEGLVEHLRDWPGVSAVRALLGGVP